MIQLDSQSLTPPGSPILGYSGTRDLDVSDKGPVSTNSSCKDVPVSIFSCKGPILSSDKTFSPDGCFRQSEVLTAIESLKSMNVDNLSPIWTDHIKNRIKTTYTFFGFEFQPFQKEQLETLIRMCRKRISALENLSQRSFSYTLSTLGSRLEDEEPEKSFSLREDVCTFLSFLVQERAALNQFDIQNLFDGFIRAIGTTKKWTTSLRHHCGSKTGNKCTSPEFHFFHVNWELRWSIVVVFSLKESILKWIIDDLLYLAYLKYKTSEDSLNQRNPFNCSCVKEFWAMLRILVEEIKPNGTSFWDIVTSGISRLELETSDILFPLWLMSYLAQLGDYDMTGDLRSTSNLTSETTCYEFTNQILKDWLAMNVNAPAQKLFEVQSFLRYFLCHWGFDLTLVTTLWSHWLLRIDKGFEVRNMDHYTSATKWLRLVNIICSKQDSNCDESNDPMFSDPFLGFLTLLAESIGQSTLKDWRKLTSTICSRLSPKVVESLSENGLLRMITMFLCMAHTAKNDVLGMCERLNETLNYGRATLRLTKIRGRCVMILLLLEKSIPVGSACDILMKNVDEIMGTLHRSSAERDLVMVYLDLIENLSKFSPDLNLDQSKLISLNLTPWLASCGLNYVTRTLRILHSLFQSWLLNFETVPTTEKSRVAKILYEKTEQFLQQSVIGNLNSTDVVPFAELAVDLTILQKSNHNFSVVNKFFQLFALSPQTSPKVNEIYVDRLIHQCQLEETDNFLSEIQLAQSWTRLITMGAVVPLKLSSKLLNPHTEAEAREAISTSVGNDVLLRKFCAFVNSAECFWTKVQLGEILAPVGASVKVAVDKGYDADNVLLGSVVRTSVLVLRKVQLEKIYARNSQSSLVHVILEGFVPSFLGKPPWEKLSPALVRILINVLPKIFIFIASTDSCMQDPFLKRKLCDTFRFAFLGFITTGELDDTNPGFLIMRHLEAQSPLPDSLLNEVMTNLQQLTKEEKLAKRCILAALGYLKRKMTLTSVCLFPILLEVMVEKDGDISSKCSAILTNCISTALAHRDTVKFTPRLIEAFETTMTKHFSFRSKRFFDFFNSLANYGIKKHYVRDFVYKEILSLLNKQIQMSEAKQGAGSNYAMRTQLKVLEANLRKTMEYASFN